MVQSFAFDHATLLATFQTDGDPRFLWGLNRSTRGLFYLEENQAAEHRDHVVANVTCPVPGCDAQLTTVHSTIKRDHLRHRSSSGGHGPESLFHSQGCALIESWLARRYPACLVKREEYTSAEGESRADVLITHPSGERIAFEVQYSPLTADAWNDRHERYSARGVRDVWLFGHTRKQLKLDGADRLKSNPALDAVVASGAPLLFINPELEQIAVVVEQRHPISATSGQPLLEHPVDVLGRGTGSSLEVHPLDDFRLGASTLTSDRVDWLISARISLDDYNAEQQRLYAIAREQAAERARILQSEADERERLGRAERAAQEERAKRRRVLMADGIRRALDSSEPWGTEHPAVRLLHPYLNGHRDRNLGWEDYVPERWKCLAFFHHVAANEDTRFGPPQVASTLRRHGVRLEKGIFKVIALWLRQLVEDDFLFEERGEDGHSVYRPTYRGTWW
ncbi:competence protein CoiA family protein [Curtobacterium sp. MCBD17_008]|uniref:competence protein CoiA family protein n=1 Tax=Curtobacterium sp. MCBD17_008 TaxID=2175656 RepID=UPI000DA846ED|nr:competence protein CoiA family protein [Curtobacterium sp. MCBD17_008]PZE92497.1 hypothetical protein DEI95_08210 [Curtobacterium sp. MCBD17_008]